MATIIDIDNGYAVSGNGTTDDTAAIQAVINNLPDRGGIIQFGPKDYRITSPLIIGEGTVSAISTVCGVQLVGVGGVGEGEYGTPSYGTRILYDGTTSTSAAVIRLNGPVHSCRIDDMVLDCNSKAGIGLDVIHAYNCSFKRVSNQKWTQKGISLTTRSSEVFGATQDCMDNSFHQCYSRLPATTSGAGVYLNALSGAVGCSRNKFYDCTFLIPGDTGSYGIHLSLCDNNAFYNCFTAYQGSPTLGKGVFLEYVAPGFPAGSFPRETMFSNCVLVGGFHSTGTPHYSNMVLGYALTDAQPTIPSNIGVRAILNDGTFVNMSTGSGDGTAPTFVSATPADNAVNVSAGNNLTITFSEPVQAGAGNVVIENLTSAADTRTISVGDTSQVSFSGSTMTVNPTSDLQTGHDYQITLQPGVVKDLSGTSYAGLSSGQLNFATFAPDVSAPALTSAIPASSATNVSVDSNITLNFSEPIAVSGIVMLYDATSSGADSRTIALAGDQVSVSANTIVINPSANLLVDKNYLILMSNGAVKDLSGNNFFGTMSGSLGFTTTSAGVSYTTVVSSNLGSLGSTDLNGYNARMTVPGSSFPSNYNNVKITLKAHPSWNASFGDMYLGNKATSGNVYDFASTPTRITASGSNGLLLVAGSARTMDAVSFTGSAGKDLVVSVGLNASTKTNFQNPVTGWTYSYKSGSAADAGVADVGGMASDAGVMGFISKIEVS